MSPSPTISGGFKFILRDKAGNEFFAGSLAHWEFELRSRAMTTWTRGVISKGGWIVATVFPGNLHLANKESQS